MKAGIGAVVGKATSALVKVVVGPHALAFVPALALMSFWAGGEIALITVAIALPLLALFIKSVRDEADPSRAPSRGRDTITSTDALHLTQKRLDHARAANMSTACILIELDGIDVVQQRSGEAAAEDLRLIALSRLRNKLRSDDQAVRIGDARFLVSLAPALRLDLESLLQMATRLQSILEEPTEIENSQRYMSASIGFCGSSRVPDKATGTDLFEAAQSALVEAIANGPSAIRAWSDGMRAARNAQRTLVEEVERALGNGQIQPWFQPQICTSTGAVSGVEALARWIHPDRGIVPPGQFLRSLEDAGQMGRLTEVILQHSLTALRSWDQAGLDVPRVSVNFADAELRDPKLVERIQWELDRFGLTAPRLGIEVLETVIAGSPEGIVARNIVALGELGCHLDLDDFGTGHASITALRRFQVHRLKIDRSFVTRVDRDEDQRRMLAAVLGMADRLGLETLAEGVETVGEHALLAQLGCDHVQGFGIGRPMPGDQMIDWVTAHTARIADAQNIGRSAS